MSLTYANFPYVVRQFFKRLHGRALVSSVTAIFAMR